MMASPIRTVEMLKNEIEKTKQSLVKTDETIKRITGREGVENRRIRTNNENFDRRLSRDQRFDGRSALTLNRKRLNSNSEMGLGRRTSRNYEEDDDFERSKMSVASSVVATNRISKSREEIIEQQHKDKEGNARNKRMFGLLMGTLQSFKTDGGKNERQEKKRREIERRLEEKEKEEKERAKKERQDLFLSKKQNEIKLRRLQMKMDVVQLHEEWEEQSNQLTNFIRTDTKPHIYYLPKVHNRVSMEKLEKSMKLIEAVVAKRRKLLDEELKNILEGKKDEDDEEKEGPPRKQARTTEKQTTEDNDGVDSEAELDKNISEDFQITAVNEVILPLVEVKKDDEGEKDGGKEEKDGGKEEKDGGKKEKDGEKEEKMDEEKNGEEFKEDEDKEGEQERREVGEDEKEDDEDQENNLKSVEERDNDGKNLNNSNDKDDEMAKTDNDKIKDDDDKCDEN